MRRYNITVNGKTYEVEVEEIGGNLVPRGHIRPAAAAASTTAPVAPEPAAPAKQWHRNQLQHQHRQLRHLRQQQLLHQ